MAPPEDQLAVEGRARGARILVVDDEPAVVRVVAINLRKHNFRVESVSTAQAVLATYVRIRPDLVVLDLGLPDMDGFEVIRLLRMRANTPIVVLSVCGAEKDKVAALELGADDYPTKPFSPAELLVRIRVALRHAARPLNGTEAVMAVGQLMVDREYRKVTLADREVHLTPTEYDLLKLFMAPPSKQSADGSHAARGGLRPAYRQQAHSLHVYVARLRRKIQADPQLPRYL